MRLILPWPPKELSPNARLHHMALYRAKKAYRHACGMTAMSQGARRMDAERLAVHLVFCPPNKQRRDADNCLAAMKAGLDGLADALGVDDSRWRVSFEMGGQIGGMVTVDITALDEAKT
jgi:crossover junction endodeoxyribonuclease RusA